MLSTCMLASDFVCKCAGVEQGTRMHDHKSAAEFGCMPLLCSGIASQGFPSSP